MDRSDADLIEQFRRQGRRRAPTPSKQVLGVESSRATRLLAQFEPDLAGAAPTNGHTAADRLGDVSYDSDATECWVVGPLPSLILVTPDGRYLLYS
jgi:hypothetical protein